MNKIKTRHAKRAMHAKRRGKHTTRKGYGKYKKHYTRKNVKRIQGQGKRRLRRQRQTRRKVGGFIADNTMSDEVPIHVNVNVNSQNTKTNPLNPTEELPTEKLPTEELPIIEDQVTTALPNAQEDDKYSSLTTGKIKGMLRQNTNFRVSPKCMFLCENDYCDDIKLLEKIRKRFIEFIKRKKKEGNFTYDIDFDFKFDDDDDDDDDDTDYDDLEIQDLLNSNELLAKMLEKNSMFFIVDNLVEKVKDKEKRAFKIWEHVIL